MEGSTIIDNFIEEAMKDELAEWVTSNDEIELEQDEFEELYKIERLIKAEEIIEFGRIVSKFL
jgi:hypothetical protein